MGITVGIVDDHTFVAKGLSALLREQSDIETLLIARSIAEARACLAAPKPDILTLDLKLPDGHGFQLLRSFATRARPRCIVITSFDHEYVEQAALRLGASAFFSKGAEFDAIVEGIRSCAKHGGALDARQRRLLNDPLANQLTAREAEVLLHVALGFTNKQIAEALKISPLTVKNHVERLLQKLSAPNRAALAGKAAALGLARPE